MKLLSGTMQKLVLAYVKDQLQAMADFMFIASQLGVAPTNRKELQTLLRRAFEFVLLHGTPTTDDVRQALKV